MNISLLQNYLLYDRYLYKSIIWAFWACLEDACVYIVSPIPVKCVAIVQPVGVPIRVICQLGRDINHASLVVEYSRGGLLELYRDPKGQSRGCGMASFKTVP